MKKHLAVLITVAMVLGFVLPVMANPFTDVPLNHWAYEAVKQLAAYGLIEGFPDGSYKGQEPMTRYQMAIVVARLLSGLDAEIKDVKDVLASGLELERQQRVAELEGIDSAISEAKSEAVEISVAIAEELAQKAAREAAEAAVEAVDASVKTEEITEAPIIEKIIEKHIIENEGPIDEATLDAKVSESIALIEVVKAEFAMELAVLGVRVSDLEEELSLATARIDDVREVTRELSVKLAQASSKLEETNAKLDKYIAQHEKVKISGESKVSFEDVNLGGPGTPWKDPFDEENEAGNEDYQYMPTSKFDHDLSLKLTANVDKGIVVEAGLDTITKILGGGWDQRAFRLKDGGLYLDITSPGIINHIRVGNVAEPPGSFTDFTLQGHLLRDDDGDPENEGALGEFKYNALSGTGLFWRLQAPIAGEDPKYARYAAAIDTKLALTEAFSAGATYVTVFDDEGSLEVGPETVEKDTVIGVNAKATLAPGWEAEGEIARHTADGDPSLAYKVDLSGRVWLVDLDGSYIQVAEGFSPYFVEVPYDEDEEVGVDNNIRIARISASLPVGNVPGGDLVVSAGLEKTGNAKWSFDNEDLITKGSVGATYSTGFAGADIVADGGLSLAHNHNTSETAIADSFEMSGSVFAVYSPFTASYAITDTRDTATRAVVSKKNVLDLGFEYDITPNIALSAGYKSHNFSVEDERLDEVSQAYTVKRVGIDTGFDLTPITKVTGSYGYRRVDYSSTTPWTEDSDETEGVRITAKAGLEMALSPATKIFGEAGIESGSLSPAGLPVVDGRLTGGKVGLTHDFTENAGLELGYEMGVFRGTTDPDTDYRVNRATACLTVGF